MIRRVRGIRQPRLRHRWRRSLQTRVIATTLVLSGTVSVLIGVTILHQVRAGLLDSATRSALGQLSTGVESGAEPVRGGTGSGTRTAWTGRRTAWSSELSPSSQGDEYDVAMLPRHRV